MRLVAPALLLLFALYSLVVLRAALKRRNLQRLLRAGDLGAALAAHHPTFNSMPHPETLGPLLVAAALAAHGLVDRARRTLDRAARGAAWDAAVEHRFFVETLLEAFDGDRARAVEHAESLEKLPLPAGNAKLARRVSALRVALSALARAFARRARPGDAELLEAAADESPLVHWAMRYGAAVAHLEHGNKSRAQRLLAGAPSWPADSAFRAFQEELTGLAAAPPGV